MIIILYCQDAMILITQKAKFYDSIPYSMHSSMTFITLDLFCFSILTVKDNDDECLNLKSKLVLRNLNDTADSDYCILLKVLTKNEVNLTCRSWDIVVVFSWFLVATLLIGLSNENFKQMYHGNISSKFK